MLWGANRNFTKLIVKSFPAYRQRVRLGRGSSDDPRRQGPVVTPTSTARQKILARDSERRRLLRSPLRWILVLSLGYLVIDTLRETHGLGLALLFLIAVLWGSAFARTLTFRVMCSGILAVSTVAFGLYDVELLRIMAMTSLSLVLLALALRSLPADRVDRVGSDAA